MDVFGALGDPVRRALLEQLAGGPMRVADLAAGQDVSRPAVSKHLRLLGEAGLVAATDRGRERHYALRVEGLRPVRDLVDRLAPAASGLGQALDALDTEVHRVGRDRRTAEGRPGRAAARRAHTDDHEETA